MPLPTTRYARYKYRQKKFAKRRRNFARHNDCIGPESFGHHGGGKRWTFYSRGLQAPAGVSSASYSGNQYTELGAFGVVPNFSVAGYARPPHVKFTGFLYNLIRSTGQHQQAPFLCFHARRALHTGHKLNRMNGTQRQLMGAEWHGYVYGYYPAWDPASRYPQLIDLLLDPFGSIGGLWPWGDDPT